MYKNKIMPFVIFILLILGMALFPYIPLQLFHVDYDSFSATMKIVYEFVCDIGFMIIVFLLYYKSIINNFKEYITNFKKMFKLSFKYYIIGFVIMVFANFIIQILFDTANANNEIAVRNLIDLYPIYMFFSVSLYAPFIEEIIFRKAIYDCFISFGDNKLVKYLYIVVSGFIFSALHVFGGNSYDYIYIIPYLGLGCAFGALFYKTKGNIFSTMVMHSLHNTIAIILYLVVGI